MDINYNNYNDISEILKALSHPVRLCIVRGLLQNGKCNVSHMQECLKLPQSTVSQHLQKLKAAGIIKGERQGLEIKYTLVNEIAIKIINSLFEK
jgi:DNA-binding transcriptional ArsR family regulator